MPVHTVTVDFHVRSETPAEAEAKIRRLLQQGFHQWPPQSITLRGIRPDTGKRRRGKSLT